MDRLQQLQHNLDSIRPELGSAQLIAVSKYSPLSDVLLMNSLGQKDFGENRVDDLLEKAETALLQHRETLRWHFIGQLQSNKLARLLQVPNLVAIHSIDSMKLLEMLHQRIGSFKGERLDFYLQVNTSDEAQKGGVYEYVELKTLVEFYLKQKHPKLHFAGLMTLGKIDTQHFEQDARACFQKLAEMRDQLQQDFKLPSLKLCMGMSQDYKIALAEGADLVRIGTALFKA